MSISYCIHGQNKVQFTYDNAGNRIKRDIVMTRSLLAEDDVTEPELFTEKMGERIIHIYPNPTKGDLTITISDDDFSVNGYLTLFDLAGKIVTKLPLNSMSTRLDITSQPNGIYIMQIELNDEKTSWKIIKE